MWAGRQKGVTIFESYSTDMARGQTLQQQLLYTKCLLSLSSPYDIASMLQHALSQFSQNPVVNTGGGTHILAVL